MCPPQTDAQIKVFKEAVSELNNGSSFETINNCLYKASGFRTVLFKPNKQLQFKAYVAPVLQKQD